MKSFLAVDIRFLNIIPALVGLLLGVAATTFAQEDKEGCKDHPMFPRLPNFSIYTCQELDGYEIRNEKGTWTRIEGKGQRVLYEIKHGAKPPGSQQIVRKYQDEAKKLGGSVIYEDQYSTSIKLTRNGSTSWVIVSAQSSGETYDLAVIGEMRAMQDVSEKQTSYATITNETYGFTAKYPSSWSAQSTYLSDPLPDLEAFKSGKVGLDVTLGTRVRSTEKDNAVKFNAVVATGDPASPPGIEISAHLAPSKTCEQLTREVKEWMQMFGQKLVSASTITTATKLEGCDYTYSMPMGAKEVFSRMVVLFKGGKRFVIRYFEQDKAHFERNARAFEEVLHLLTVTK
jgi:hypothetical protein